MTLTEYEARIAHALECQFGAHWYLRGAHPQTVDDYLRATDEPSRVTARNRMQRDAITYAAGVLNACLGEGIIKA
jgi:hypothetical protein